MRRENIILFIVPVVLLLLGIFSGYYFGVYKTSLAVTACEIEKALIPSSLIVDSSSYNPKTHQLTLSLENPGGMPIQLISKTLIVNPGTKNAVVLAMNIPLDGIVIKPFSKIDLNLQIQGSGLKLGDIVTSTLNYKLPISPDIYSVVHVFQHSGQLSNGLIKNKLEETNQMRKSYNQSHAKQK